MFHDAWHRLPIRRLNRSGGPLISFVFQRHTLGSSWRLLVWRLHRQIRFDKHFDPSTSVGVQNQGHEILSLVVKCR